MPGLGQQQVMVFLATRNGVAARKFYEGTLGLRVISDDDFALAVAVDDRDTMLRVQKVPAFTPHPFTSLGWQVVDISSTVKDLGSRGVDFQRYPGLDQDAHGVWRSPSGAQVAWFKDPDGNTLSLTQIS